MPSTLLVRSITFGLLAVAVLQHAPAQMSGDDKRIDDKLPARPASIDSRADTRLREIRDGKRRLTAKEDQANKDAFKAVADYYVYAVNVPTLLGQDPTADDKLYPRRPEQYLESVLIDLRRILIAPNGPDPRMTTDQAEYVQQFGVALDDAVQVMLKSKHPVVRVNAARVLVAAAETGAAAHAKTITALLTDPNTRPEVLLYAYKAAGRLLAAYDALATGTANPDRHSIPDELLVPLVEALESHVLNGPPVLSHVAVPKPPLTSLPADPQAAPGTEQPAGARQGRLDAATLTPEQLAVLRYFRREAVRALARVRFDVIGGKELGGKVVVREARPAFTLARVAASDPAINPSPSTSEVAEAVGGLLRIVPTAKLNVDELAQAVAAGIETLGRVRNTPAAAVKPEDETTPWKVTAARLTDGFTAWKASTGRSPRANAYRAVIQSLSDAAVGGVVSRLDVDGSGGAVGNAPDVGRVSAWRAQNPPKDPTRSLYNDSPKYRVAAPAPGQ